MRVGTLDVASLAVGSTKALKAYLGNAVVWQPALGGYGPSETIITGTPPATFNTLPFRVGNRYDWHVAGRIVGARFWRHASMAELSHVIYLYNYPALTIVATSQPSVETAGYVGWVQVSFATPILIAAGGWILAADLTLSYYSNADFAVHDPSHVVLNSAIWGPIGDPTFTNTGAYNFYVDAIWQPVTDPWGSPAYLLSDQAPFTTSGGSYRIGNEYQAVATGRIVGVRFYRAATETLFAHQMVLYDKNQAVVATVSSSGETATAGWVTVPLPTPFNVAAGDHFTVTVDIDTLLAYSGSVPVVVRPDQAIYVSGHYGSPPSYPTAAFGGDYATDALWQAAL